MTKLQTPNPKKLGFSTVMIVIVLAVLAFLLILIYAKKGGGPSYQKGTTNQVQQLSPSDEVSDIDNDLKTTSLDFDSDFSAVDSDLRSL